MLYNHSAKEEDKWFSISQTLCFGLSWIQIHVLESQRILLEITAKEWDWIPPLHHIKSEAVGKKNYMCLNLRSSSVNGGNHVFPRWSLRRPKFYQCDLWSLLAYLCEDKIPWKQWFQERQCLCKCILCTSLGRRNSHNHCYKGEPSLTPLEERLLSNFFQRDASHTQACVRLN